jgi:hypothetical protein
MAEAVDLSEKPPTCPVQKRAAGLFYEIELGEAYAPAR